MGHTYIGHNCRGTCSTSSIAASKTPIFEWKPTTDAENSISARISTCRHPFLGKPPRAERRTDSIGSSREKEKRKGRDATNSVSGGSPSARAGKKWFKNGSDGCGDLALRLAPPQRRRPLGHNYIGIAARACLADVQEDGVYAITT